MSKTAVVILNWNGIDYLKNFLPALIRYTCIHGVELVVADNASSDGSVEFLESEYPGIQVLKLDKNYGFTGGYNKALAQLKADYFMILNSDIEVTEGWIQPLIALMDKQADVAACSPLLLDYNNKENYEYAGAAGGYIDKYGYTFCRGRIFDKLEEVQSNYNKPADVFWTTGACMLVRAEMFQKAGGFDEHFFAHMEEVDLCWRWKNMGFKLKVLPNSKVYHVGGGTLPKSNPFKTYLNFRNNLFLLYKNLPRNKMSKVLFIRILLDYLSVIRFLASFSFKDIKAIFKAHRDFQRKKVDYIAFRESQHSKIVKSDHEERYSYSIVLDYFLLGRKRFSQLRGDFAKKFINN
jgi:GT2 family glycosyltransferase